MKETLPSHRLPVLHFRSLNDGSARSARRYPLPTRMLLGFALTLIVAAPPTQGQIHQPDVSVAEDDGVFYTHPRALAVPEQQTAEARETTFYGSWSISYARLDPDGDSWDIFDRPISRSGVPFGDGASALSNLPSSYSPSADQRSDKILIRRSGLAGFAEIFAVELEEDDGSPGDLAVWDPDDDEAWPLESIGFQANPRLSADSPGSLLLMAYDTDSALGGSGFDQEIVVARYANGPGGLTSLGEERINSYVAGQQQFPSISAPIPGLGLNDGSFLIVWQSFGSAGGDSNLTSIQAHYLDKHGQPQGEQFQVNTLASGFQSAPEVAALDDGTSVIVWQSDASYGDDDSLTSIQARLFGSDGAALGLEFQVNEEGQGFQYQPTVAALGDGGFIVAWTDQRLVDADIWARRYGQGAVPVGEPFRVNTTTAGDQDAPHVASDGRDFLVVFQSQGGIYANGSFGRIFADGFESGDTSDW